jgi:hypothetical protein
MLRAGLVSKQNEAGLLSALTPAGASGAFSYVRVGLYHCLKIGRHNRSEMLGGRIEMDPERRYFDQLSDLADYDASPAFSSTRRLRRFSFRHSSLTAQ